MDRMTKLEHLRDLIQSFGSLAVAYSGGVDSTFLLAAAHEILGDHCLAVIATSSTYPKRELESALEWVKERGVRHLVIASEEIDIPGYADNPPDRCFHCKKELFSKIKAEAAERCIDVVSDGANADDTGDFRPGLRAARELGVRSPLMECGITKEDIRALSREVYHLPTADRQSMACMASRIPYGSPITREKLGQIEAVEDFLSGKGFRVYRARHHGDLLRLELGREDMKRLLDGGIDIEIVALAKKLGFVYVTLDLQGFRSGSMNEALKPEVIDAAR